MFSKVLSTLFITLLALGAQAEEPVSAILCSTTGQSFGTPTHVNVSIDIEGPLGLSPVPTQIVARGQGVRFYYGQAHLTELVDGSLSMHFETQEEDPAHRTLMDIQLATEKGTEGIQLTGAGRADILQTLDTTLFPHYNLASCEGLIL